MPNSTPHPAAWWPSMFYAKMDELLAAPDQRVVIATAGRRDQLASRMQKWSAFRRSLYLYGGWPSRWHDALQDYDIHLERVTRGGVFWELAMFLKPTVVGLDQIIDETVQDMGSGG